VRKFASVLVVSFALSIPAGVAAANPKTPPPTTIPTLKSSTGHLYSAGEFCPKKDLGKRDHGKKGVLLKCERRGEYDRWERV
jgi:hypothetical protein